LRLSSGSRSPPGADKAAEADKSIEAYEDDRDNIITFDGDLFGETIAAAAYRE
jgi:hypothetical protein